MNPIPETDRKRIEEISAEIEQQVPQRYWREVDAPDYTLHPSWEYVHFIEKLLFSERYQREQAERKGYEKAWNIAHSPAGCGHARANWKDPQYGTLEYQGNEQCEVCLQLSSLREHMEQADDVLKIVDDFLNDMLARHDGSSDTKKFFTAGQAVHQFLRTHTTQPHSVKS